MTIIQNPLLFFFSSRRRHTRLQGDWSSDVCSSDLVTPDVSMLPHRETHNVRMICNEDRSEERRVGKEWRYHWLQNNKKKMELERESEKAIVSAVHDEVHVEKKEYGWSCSRSNIYTD